MSDIRVPSVDPSPADDGVLAGAFQPRSKSSFLTAMLRTLSAGSRALMYYGPGSLPHRLLEAVAMELSQLSFDVRRMMLSAVREAAYRAFSSPETFPPRFPATFCSGLVQVRVPLIPLQAPFTIDEGDLFATDDGLTVRALETVVLGAGEFSALVPVVSEVAGPGGAIPAGGVTSYLHSTALRASNPAAIGGGRAEETDDAIHARFQNYIRGIQTASGRSVLSAAEGASAQGVRAAQAALVLPWRVPHLNAGLGVAYVVLDAGGGSAPPALVADAQTRIDAVSACAEQIVAVACSPYAVGLRVQAECRRDADTVRVRAALAAAYERAFEGSAIEDGSGRGRISTGDLRAILDAVPGVLTVTLPDVEGGWIDAPIFGRAVAGVPDITVTRGL